MSRRILRGVWKNEPISRTCEVKFTNNFKHCGRPTAMAYRASLGGWMALCKKHGEEHKLTATPIDQLITQGETFSG